MRGRNFPQPERGEHQAEKHPHRVAAEKPRKHAAANRPDKPEPDCGQRCFKIDKLSLYMKYQCEKPHRYKKHQVYALSFQLRSACKHGEKHHEHAAATEPQPADEPREKARDTCRYNYAHRDFRAFLRAFTQKGTKISLKREESRDLRNKSENLYLKASSRMRFQA
jgi:hypothetical protein